MRASLLAFSVIVLAGCGGGSQASSGGRSPELEEIRRRLFPDLPADEGWAKIDRALNAAADQDRLDRVEELAGRDLGWDLAEIIRQLLVEQRLRDERTTDDPAMRNEDDPQVSEGEPSR
jgi:hypothetical protein